MKITVLGGGSEIGASCLHIQMDDTSILIDAGMRMHGENVLPMLGMLEELSKPDAILVTHAHADHIGALPVVHTLFPNVPIYATPPTADLMQVMLKDSFKILTEQTRQTQSLMPYTEDEVTKLLQNILVFPAKGVIEIGNMKITAYRAGHIIGAVMFFIETVQESLLVTGDISFSGARTIPGAKVPQNIHPDVVVMESTYGNRLHTDRNTEEKRLAENVAATIENGGFALVPAFALGRAQEVLLILQDYMNKGLIPTFPIYVDGLVTPVSQIYRGYPHYLKGPVAHRIRTNGDAFLTEGRCIAVKPQDRKEIINGKPACIVASSGMLTGGASAWYARQLVSNQKHAVFITGYQDEESPGRKLLALAEGTEHSIDIDGTTYEVNCRVDRFGLSAHADANEMTRFIETLEPTYTLLVHGDDDARSSLETKIHPRFHPVLVENGETYPFEKRKEGKGIIGKRYKTNPKQDLLRRKIGHVLLYKKADDSTLKFGLCQNVHPKTSTLYCDTPKGKVDRVEASQVVESLGMWNLSIDVFQNAANKVLSFSRPYLKNINWDLIPEYTLSLQEIFRYLDVTEETTQFAISLALQSIPETYRHTDLEGTIGYKLDQHIRFQLSNLDLPIQGLKMNPNLAMDIVRSYFADDNRFLRCGVQHLDTKDEHILLSFRFPGAISSKERERIMDCLIEQTGWDIRLSESVRHEEFQPLIQSLLEEYVEMPSVHVNESIVVTKHKKPDNSAEITKAFQEITGFTLHFAEETMGTQVKADEDQYFMTHSNVEPMEINQAIATAKSLAEEYAATLYKASKREINGNPVMELHFISPEIAANYREMMQVLSRRVGMDVTAAKQPKQNEIIRITKEMIPASWKMSKNPSLHMDRGEVMIKLATDPEGKEWDKVAAVVKEQTGYDLMRK